MNKTITRVLSLVMALIMMLAVCATLASCADKKTDDPVNNNQGNQDNGGTTNTNPDGTPVKLDYTYKAGTTALGTAWNPHNWETNADNSLLSYVSSPFVDMSIKTTGDGGVYQWVYEMATEVNDVTAANQAALTKYNVKLNGADPATITEGYVYEIKLNPNAAWENGVKITADDYIYSMEMLLHPKFRNYRANLYYSGESAVAGGSAFYNSEAPLFSDVKGSDAEANLDALIAEGKVFFTFTGLCYFFGANSMQDYADAGYEGAGYFNCDVDEEGNPISLFSKYEDAVNAYSMVPVTAENKDEVIADLTAVAQNFGDTNPEAYVEFLLYISGYGDKVDYDVVGCYKVDDYTIHYVCEQYLARDYFLTSLTSTWLVYKPYYSGENDEKIDKSGELWTTDYNTSKETTMSYGTYKMESLQDGKQVIFVQNENWYGFEKNEDGTPKKDNEGNLISYTNFLVDGEKVRQYTTTKIVIDVMTEDAMKNAFFKGELSEWSPSADELSQYAMSDKLTQVDETYTMSFFFNTGLDTLQKLDAAELNQNSVVLNNYNFRKAMSLAINRAEFVTATAGYKPAFSLMNSLYHYNIYEDPTSSYRNTDEAMKAIVNLYGVEYGEGKTYATLKEAHDSITGYNLTEAKALMATACQELVAAGLYTAGADIKIQIGWAKGALTSDDNKQVALLNEQVNKALEGSGFGKITFEAVGNIQDRYAAVPDGEYAIGYGAWGGAAFYPFRNMQVYCDTVEYAGRINEMGCWDPSKTDLTININGEDVTMTWQDWSRACTNGAYATADFATKLKITSTMEEEFLKFYYRIPLCGTTICSLLGYKMDNYTDDYNIMYGFGGFRLMKYNFTDAEWTDYVASVGGTLNYK